MTARRLAAVLVLLGGLVAGGAQAAPRLADCEPPEDARYLGAVDARTGAFTLICTAFPEPGGVSFAFGWLASAKPDAHPSGGLGAGWGMSLDDRLFGLGGMGASVRNGVDGSVSDYRARSRGEPLLAVGPPDLRKAGCERVEPEGLLEARRVFCSRTLQHFDADGRLTRYSTHLYHQVFTLNWGDGQVSAVTSASVTGKPLSIAFERQASQVVATNQDGAWIRFTLDGAGRVSRVEDAAGGRYDFGYNGTWDLILIERGDGAVQRISYTRAGRVRQITTFRGETIQWP